jgi:hypothetical protein
MPGHYEEKNIMELVKQSGELYGDFKTIRRDQIQA